MNTGLLQCFEDLKKNNLMSKQFDRTRSKSFNLSGCDIAVVSSQ